MDELVYGPLPPADVEDPYLPLLNWQIRASDLYLRLLSQGDPDAAPLSRGEVLELHELLVREFQHAVAWHIRRGDAGALRRFVTDRGGPLGLLVGRLSILEQVLPELAPDEPRVRDAVLEAVRRRADLLETVGPDAAAGDLREADGVAGLGGAAGRDLSDALRRMSDAEIFRLADAAARRAESLRVSLMSFAVGGEMPPEEARGLIDRYGRHAELVRAAVGEARRRRIILTPAPFRALRLHEQWAPRFEAELARRLGLPGGGKGAKPMPKRRRRSASGGPGGSPVAATALAELAGAWDPESPALRQWHQTVADIAGRPLQPEEAGDPADPYAPFDETMWDLFDELFNRTWVRWRQRGGGDPFPLGPSDASALHVSLVRLVRWSIASTLRATLPGRSSHPDDDRHFRMLLEYEETLPPEAPRAADALRAVCADARRAAMNGDPAWAPRLTLGPPAEPPRREPPTPLEAAAIRAERARAAAAARALSNAPAAEIERALAEYDRRVGRLARLAREAEARGEAVPDAAARALRLAEEWRPRLAEALERARAREGGGSDA